MFLLSRPALIPVLILTLSSAIIFMSCEPESLEESLPESSVNVSEDANMKKSTQDLPHKELAQLRAVIAPWHNLEKAEAAGYELEFTGYRSMMGYHYLNVSLLDEHFEVTQPEVLMFAPAPNGELRLVGVEYAVPIPDMTNPQAAPEGFSGDADVWAINTEFEVWTLHVWVGLNNPRGIFAMHNPRLP